jgi:hypothetical protein
MAPRKETPDLLSEILGGEPAPALPAVPQPKPAPRPKRPSAEAAGRSPARRPAWEYMEVVFRDYGGYRPRIINGRELPGWKRMPVIHEYLNLLGEQGWELAGVGSRDNREMPAYFKRLK